MFASRPATFALKVLGDHSALKTAISGSGKTRVVAWCTASWCGPCKSITPFVTKLADGTPNLDFIKIDIDEFPEVAEELEVASVPTFIMYKDAKMVGRLTGANGAKIEEMVKDNM